ncbi:MAG: hypothetical protein ACP5JG_07855 [Anaerolineae bacterium]
MAVRDRNRQLRVVAEILLIHIPDLMNGDDDLVRDLLSVVGTALQDVYEDAEQSAKAWDKRAYHVRADELRREWGWALGAANYATGLALHRKTVTEDDLRKLKQIIEPDLEKPGRKQISDPTRFRGAAQAVRRQQAQKRKPVRW